MKHLRKPLKILILLLFMSMAFFGVFAPVSYNRDQLLRPEVKIEVVEKKEDQGDQEMKEIN